MSEVAKMTLWPKNTIAKSSYLRGRIGWQGLRASEFTEEGPYLITGTDFQNGKIDWDGCYHVTEERYAEAEYIHVRDDDILITKDGTIGKVAYAENCPPQAVLNSGIFLLRCKDRSYHHRYMYHLLRSFTFLDFLDNNLAGSTIQHLYQNVFEKFEFPTPLLEEQKTIADVLDAIDKAIAQTEAIITKQQRIKTGLMQDLLTRGIDEHGNIRTEATHAFKDSPLGRIPVEWEVVSIQDVAIQVTDGDHHTPQRSNEGIFLLSARNILNGRIDLSSVDYVSEKEYQRMIRRCFPQPGDILISCSGTIGRVCEIPKGLRCVLVRSAALIKPQNTLLNSRFAEWILRSNQLQTQILTSQRQAAQPNLFQGEIKALKIFRPPLYEQEIISSTLDRHEQNCQYEEAKAEKLTKIKTGLMQDLLTGKVRVTELLKSSPHG